MARSIRYLRIAFSALCGIVCLMFVLLWVRSYRTHDVVRSDLGVIKVSGDCRFGTIHLLVSASTGVGVSVTSEHLGREGMRGMYAIPSDLMNARPNWTGIGLIYPPGHTVLCLPNWFAAGLFALSAAAPWLRWRFSLRTLLLATSALAIVLGILAYGMRG